jgi:glycosyltransferase involved in cell wall biosynthesis
VKNKKFKPTGSVSVIIPAYNSENFIRRAIDSVLAQTHRAEEIIVVDDGSTDSTREIVQSYGPPVQYLHQENAGPGAARNAGIRAAQGDWIAFLDHDDEWLPEKLQVQLNLLKRHPDLVWASSNFQRCLCDQNRQGPDLAPAQVGQGLAGKEYFDSYFSAYLLGCGGCTDTKIIQRQVFDTVGLFQVGIDRSEDMDLWCRIAFRWPRMGFSPKPLAIYHMEAAPGLTREHVEVDVFSQFIDRNLKLAEKYDRLEDFKPFASRVLQLWMRAQIFSGDSQGLRHLLDRHGDWVPSGFRRIMRIAVAFPRTSRAACKFLSHLVRLLRLRPQITRKSSG